MAAVSVAISDFSPRSPRHLQVAGCVLDSLLTTSTLRMPLSLGSSVCSAFTAWTARSFPTFPHPFSPQSLLQAPTRCSRCFFPPTDCEGRDLADYLACVIPVCSLRQGCTQPHLGIYIPIAVFAVSSPRGELGSDETRQETISADKSLSLGATTYLHISPPRDCACYYGIVTSVGLSSVVRS